MDLRRFFESMGIGRLGVAASGGVDSTALLVALAEWEERPFELFALHVNHALRGVESDGDEAFVRGICDRYGIAMWRTSEPPHEARVRDSGVENAAREVRRKALLRAHEDLGLDAIATAHQADDQAESMLLALLRGGGARRLAGIRAIDPPWVRPLLETRRHELTAFLESRNITPRLDSTNAESRFLRNRIRHELLPVMAALQPKVVEHLGEIARQLRESEHEIEIREVDWRSRFVEGNGATTRIALEGIGESPFLFRRVLLDTAFAIDPTARELSAGDLRRITAHVRSSTAPLQLTRDLRVVAENGEILFLRNPEPSPGPLDQAIGADGTMPWAPLGCLIRVEEGRGEGDAFALPDEPGELRIRNRRDGDRWHPPGSSSTKKLKDVFIERKIERTLRDRLPMLTWNDEVVWVARLGVSNRFLPREGCSRIFAVQVLESE